MRIEAAPASAAARRPPALLFTRFPFGSAALAYLDRLLALVFFFSFFFFFFFSRGCQWVARVAQQGTGGRWGVRLGRLPPPAPFFARHRRPPSQPPSGSSNNDSFMPMPTDSSRAASIPSPRRNASRATRNCRARLADWGHRSMRATRRASEPSSARFQHLTNHGHSSRIHSIDRPAFEEQPSKFLCPLVDNVKRSSRNLVAIAFCVFAPDYVCCTLVLMAPSHPCWIAQLTIELEYYATDTCFMATLWPRNKK